MKRFVFLFLMMGLLVSCSSGEKPGDDGDATTSDSDFEGEEITLMIPDWGAPTEEMLEEFKEETGIKVNVEPTAWSDIKSKISIAAAGNNTPADVVEVDWSWAGEFHSAGWLESLDVDGETKEDIPALQYFEFDDEIVAIPYANGIRLAYYNKRMAQEAGVEEIPTNWEEMIHVFDQLKASGTVEYPFLFPLNAEEKTTTSFMTLAYTRNGIVFNEDDTLNREAVLDTFNLLDELIEKDFINENSVSAPGIDVFRGINNGEGAVLIGPTSFITSSNDESVSKVVGEVTNIPVPGKEGPAEQTITFTEAVGVSAFSEKKEAAKKFVDWFSRPETQLALNEAINNTPTRTSVIEKMVNEGIIKEPGAIIEQSKIIETPFPHGVPKYYTKMSTEMFNIINQFGQRKLTPEEATDKMVEAVNELVEENK
ncbi:MAG: extracellular solute-binding protein [Tissierellia bacterium]|nr:extracellular solute-binding protein [Tissierellia bacterium]